MKPWTKEEMLLEILERSVILEGRRVINAKELEKIYVDVRFPEEHQELVLAILNSVKKIKKEHEDPIKE